MMVSSVLGLDMLVVPNQAQDLFVETCTQAGRCSLVTQLQLSW